MNWINNIKHFQIPSQEKWMYEKELLSEGQIFTGYCPNKLCEKHASASSAWQWYLSPWACRRVLGFMNQKGVKSILDYMLNLNGAKNGLDNHLEGSSLSGNIEAPRSKLREMHSLNTFKVWS